MPTLLQISQLGHSILRERAHRVSNIIDPTTQALIDDIVFLDRADSQTLMMEKEYQKLIQARTRLGFTEKK